MVCCEFSNAKKIGLGEESVPPRPVVRHDHDFGRWLSPLKKYVLNCVEAGLRSFFICAELTPSIREDTSYASPRWEKNSFF
jgi:hypothetical protein